MLLSGADPPVDHHGGELIDHPAQAASEGPVMNQVRSDRTQAAIKVPGLTTEVFVDE